MASTADRQPRENAGPVAPSRVAHDEAVPKGDGPFARPGATAAGPAADYDILVVGAGPAGSETARRLALLGRSVLLVEEHHDPGRPVQCAGLIATNVFPLIDLDPHGPFHQQAIDGGHIVSPSGHRVLLKSPGVHAHAVSRAGFDAALQERAIEAGAELVRGATFVNSTVSNESGTRTATILHQAEPNGQRVRTTVSTRMLVGADGVGSEVARTSGFTERQFVLSGLEIELEGLDIADPENVHVHTGTRVAPGYFAWIVPKGRHGARVGLCVDVHRARGKSAWHHYQEYLKLPDVAALTAGGREVDRIVGCIPLGLRQRLVGEGVAVVGDAAGMAKPTSGGGIYMGCWGAKLLAPVIDGALAKGDTRATNLTRFDRAVRKTIGRELRVGAAMHRVFRALTNEELDKLTLKIDDPRILAAINKHGDIDHPSRLLLPVIGRRPSLLKYAWPATKELLGGYARLH